MRLAYGILLFLLISAVVYMAAKIFRLIFLNVGVERNTCPNCGSSYLKRSSPRKFTDFPYRIFGLRAFRCSSCAARFFAFPEPSGARTASSEHPPAKLRQ